MALRLLLIIKIINNFLGLGMESARMPVYLHVLKPLVWSPAPYREPRLTISALRRERQGHPWLNAWF